MVNDWQIPQRILVVLAHPDDPEFFCGASIASWVASGHQVVYWLLTCGDKGAQDATIDTDVLCTTRYREQRAAASVLGVEEVNFLGYPDGYLVPDIDLRRDITRIIRREQPDVLVTCDPNRLYVGDQRINHPDHRAAGQAALDAVFPAAGNPLYFPELIREDNLQPHSVSEVWVVGEQDANIHLDVTEYWEQKIRALYEHRSQIGEPRRLADRMRDRHTQDSTPEDPRYEEAFRRIVFR